MDLFDLILAFAYLKIFLCLAIGIGIVVLLYNQGIVSIGASAFIIAVSFMLGIIWEYATYTKPPDSP